MTHPTTDVLVDSLGPALTLDGDGRPNTALAGWLDGPTSLLGDIDDLVRGPDGWVHLLDPTRSPAGWLPWLAQFAGVRLADGLDEAQQRVRIVETSGQRRGTVAAIEGAARQLLSGSRLVRLEERTDPDGMPDAYRLRVTTFAEETDDPDAVEAAVRAETPAGLVLHYRMLPGASYDDLAAVHATYDQLAGAFATYDQMRTWVPEG